MVKQTQCDQKEGSSSNKMEMMRRKSKKNGVNMRVRRAVITLAAVACASSMEATEGFVVSKSPLHLAFPQVENAVDIANGSPRNIDTALFYAPPNHPTSKTAPMVAQAFYSAFATNRSPTKPRNYQNKGPLSNSVLSSSDTLPSFPTAHGLLSPETVLRMEIMTSSSTRDSAVEYFLRTYKREGPMACLPMLSDPKVLPRLTEAMRDIIQ